MVLFARCIGCFLAAFFLISPQLVLATEYYYEWYVNPNNYVGTSHSDVAQRGAAAVCADRHPAGEWSLVYLNMFNFTSSGRADYWYECGHATQPNWGNDRRINRLQCPSGEVFDNASLSCISECPESEEYNETTDQCEPSCPTDGVASSGGWLSDLCVNGCTTLEIEPTCNDPTDFSCLYYVHTGISCDTLPNDTPDCIGTGGEFNAITNRCEYDSDDDPDCPTGTTYNGDYCACPTGQFWTGNGCSNSNPECPDGTFWNGFKCEYVEPPPDPDPPPVCPDGWSWNGSSCEAPPPPTPPDVTDNDDSNGDNDNPDNPPPDPPPPPDNPPDGPPDPQVTPPTPPSPKEPDLDQEQEQEDERRQDDVDREIGCPPGTNWNGSVCMGHQTDDGSGPGDGVPVCPDGYPMGPDGCRNGDGESPADGTDVDDNNADGSCPSGYDYNPSTDECLRSRGGCEAGYYRDHDTDLCLPNTDYTSSNCDSFPACSGDPVQCGIAMTLHQQRCLVEQPQDDAVTQALEAEFGTVATEVSTTQVDIGTLSDGGASAGSCPAPEQITVFDTAIDISFQPFCDLAGYVKPLVLIFATLSGGRIVIGGL